MRTYRIAALTAALVAGLGASAFVAHADGPVTLPDLPGLGYSLSMQANAQTGCNNYVVIGGNGVDREILIGDLPPVCSTAAEEQDRIDALLADFPPMTATTAPATTAPETTTVYVTTQADPLPAVTVSTPAVTVIQPETHTVTETVTQTITMQAPEPTPEWLNALAVRSAALNALFGLA